MNISEMLELNEKAKEEGKRFPTQRYLFNAISIVKRSMPGGQLVYADGLMHGYGYYMCEVMTLTPDFGLRVA